jgi:hypothetical protein
MERQTAKIEKRYGSRIMTGDFFESVKRELDSKEIVYQWAQVTLKDLSNLKFPIIYSKCMEWKQAREALKCFEERGEF